MTALPPVLLLTAPEVPALPSGWSGRAGFVLPDEPWDLGPQRWVCVGTVADEDDAEAAVTALARGVGLAVVVELVGPARHRLLEDLHRAGRVELRLEERPHPTAEQVRLLLALAAGATLGDAAAAHHMSLRTAHRRLADVRARLGVATTAEAVTWAARRADQVSSPPPVTRPGPLGDGSR